MTPATAVAAADDGDTHTPADIDAFAAAYICAEDDIITGVQTDVPLQGAMMPSGGRDEVSGRQVAPEGMVVRHPPQRVDMTAAPGAQEMGVHSAIDTAGFLGAAASETFLDDVDLVLLDLKAGSEGSYRTLTGRSPQPTLDFGDRLARSGTRIWIRFVVVPGWSDDVAPSRRCSSGYASSSEPTASRCSEGSATADQHDHAILVPALDA